ncbi:MAG: 50S ribosomal protein L25 [Clostridiales bacterium]|nr:50S ribosomal protein L25 [Clostridiales bacterium]
MFILKAENRNTNLKPKQLRREGIIPAVLYGKNLEESLSIQIPQEEVLRFLKTNAPGSKLDLVIGGKKHLALLREVSLKPATAIIEHLTFQTLLANEVITSTMRIALVNRERVPGMIQHPQSEISYKALPAHLIDTIEIDLEGLQVGDTIRISDLEIAKNPNIEILNPLDTLVVSIIDNRKAPDQGDVDESEESIEAAVAESTLEA